MAWEFQYKHNSRTYYCNKPHNCEHKQAGKEFPSNIITVFHVHGLAGIKETAVPVHADIPFYKTETNDRK